MGSDSIRFVSIRLESKWFHTLSGIYKISLTLQSVNEFIENCIYFMLDGSSEFEFNLDESEEETKSEIKEPKVVFAD